MIFFFDENISSKAVEILRLNYVRNGEYTFEHLLSRFEQGTPDPRWMAEISQWSPKPIVMSGDHRILKNPINRYVLQQTSLSFVFFPSNYLTAKFEIQVWMLIYSWPYIVERLKVTPRPSIVQINKFDFRRPRIVFR